METKMIRVPFEVELAKKITEKSVDGKIVTRDGRSARIICWDFSNIQNIVSAISQEDGVENVSSNFYDGTCCLSSKCDEDLFIEIPEYMTFKEGDVLIDGADMPFIYNGKHDERWGYGCICGLNYNGLLSINKNIDESRWTYIIKRRATEEEKQKLIDALKASKDPQAKEYLKRFFGIEVKQGYEFKPFDKVLARFSLDSEWCAVVFSHKNEYGQYICCGSAYNQCIPYNDKNAHLLGTTDNYE